MPTCFGSTRHRTAGSTNHVTNLRMGHVVGRPATTTLTCNLSGNANGHAVTICSLNNNAFSVSVVRVSRISNRGAFRILTAGNSARLNNRSFSDHLVGCLIRRFGGSRNVSLHGSPLTVRHLGRTTRGTGVRLSSTRRASIGLPCVATSTANPGRVGVGIAHTGLRDLIRSLMGHSVRPLGITLRSTNLSMSSVSSIVLINNRAHVPVIRGGITRFFNGRPHGSIGPSRTMTVNTTIRNNILANSIGSMLLLSIAPLSLNVRAVNNIVAALVTGGAAVPAGRDRIFSATRSGRSTMAVRILRNRHGHTTSGGSLNRFGLSNVGPTPHNVPRVRIAFSVSTSNVLRISTGSGGDNGRRGVAVGTSSNLGRSRVRGVMHSTRTGTRTSHGFRRLMRAHGRNSRLLRDAHGRIRRTNSGLPTSSGATVRSTLATLRATLGNRSGTTVRTGVRRLTRISRGLVRVTRRRRTRRRATNTSTSTGGTGSSSIISTRFRRIGSGGWSPCGQMVVLAQTGKGFLSTHTFV